MRQLPVPARLAAAVMAVAASAGCVSVTDHPGKPTPSVSKGASHRADAGPDGAAAPDGGGVHRVRGTDGKGRDAGAGAGKEHGASPSPSGRADGASGAPRPHPGEPSAPGGRPSAPPVIDPPPPLPPSEPPETSPDPEPSTSAPGATSPPPPVESRRRRTGAMAVPVASPQVEPV